MNGLPKLPGLLPSAAMKVQQAAGISSQSNQDLIEAAQEGEIPQFFEEGASQLGSEIENVVSSVAEGVGEIAASSIEFGVGLTWDIIKPTLVNYWYIIIPVILILLYALYKFVF